MIHVNWNRFFDPDFEPNFRTVETVPPTGPHEAGLPSQQVTGSTTATVEPEEELRPERRSVDTRRACGARLAWQGTVVLGRRRWQGWLLRVEGHWVLATCPTGDVRLVWLQKNPVRIR